MLPKVFFEVYQKELLWMANTDAGRFLIGVKDNDKIFKLTPNSVHIWKDKKTARATFYSGDKIAEILGPIQTKMIIARKNSYKALLNYSGLERSRNYPQVYLTTTTFNPQAGNGRVYKSDDTNWANTRGTATGTATDGSLECYVSHPGNYILQRGFIPFDTSSIGATKAIVGGGNIFSLYRDDTVSDGFNNLATTRLELVLSTEANPASLAVGDFGLVTFTSGGNYTFASTSNNAYKDLTINSTADGWISKTGSTKLAIVVGLDFDNSAPTNINSICFQNSGGANKPKLQVTYQLPSRFLMFM